MRSAELLSVDSDRRETRGRGRAHTWHSSAFARTLMAVGALLLLAMAAVVGVPMELFALASPFALTAIVAILVYRAFAGIGQPAQQVRVSDYDYDEDDGAGGVSMRGDSRPTSEQRLRRRYVVGELSHAEFERGMVGVIKERFARGQLSLTAYERELDRLFERSRVAATLGAAVGDEPAHRDAGDGRRGVRVLGGGSPHT
ncbi:MAG: hypothetical protein AVDCRST_MAG77-5621 [uncultured Chloroflexi bacterium]|uniref:SHOCT domain-containing protein n=1 Tax=uncultured Chloroflexota bacterium TaxID=166587 RepID=A0A6J4K5W8_9CHLR|nr:MAG: hypothetical protein AVDCRST_MAG77-5621 [uncultured Chloroflexota bacterium]